MESEPLNYSTLWEDKVLDEKYTERVKAEKKTQRTLQTMQKEFVLSINAYALVLVLLASVTFGGFLQPPGGFKDEDSTPPGPSSQPSVADGTGDSKEVQERIEMRFFIVFNSLSFVLSVVDLLLCVISSLSPLRSIGTGDDVSEDWMPADDEGQSTLQSEQARTKLMAQYVSSTLVKLIFVNAIFAISLTCCVVAFVAAGFLSVKKEFSHRNFLAVFITLIVGTIFFAVFLVWLLVHTFRFIKRAVRYESLSTSLQSRAGSSQVQFRYLNAEEEMLK